MDGVSGVDDSRRKPDLFDEPADALARHQELAGERVGEALAGAAAVRHDAVRLVAVEQSMGEFVGGGETASPRSHVQVDQDRESDIGMVQKRSRGRVVEVRAEWRPVDGDPQQFAHGVEVTDRPGAEADERADLLRLAAHVVLLHELRTMHEGALGEAANRDVEEAGQFGVPPEEVDELPDPRGGPGIDILVGSEQHSCQVNVLRLHVATLRQVNGRDAVEPGQCAQLAVVRSPRSGLPVRHHGPAHPERRAHVVLGVAGTGATAPEGFGQVGHSAPPAMSLLRIFSYHVVMRN